MIQTTSRPTPDYDEVAHHLRSWGHEVWVTRIDENGDLLWDNGAGRQLSQEGFLPKPVQFPDIRVSNTLWTHISHLVFVRQIRKMIRMLEPDIVQINSSSLHYISLIPVAMPEIISFILDFRQIGDRRLPNSLPVKIRNKIRSVSRRAAAVYFFDHSCYLHSAGAEKGLGRNWKRWGTVVPMGVHDSFLNSVRENNGQSREDDETRFIYVGTVARIRQLETIFTAIRIVADKTSRFCFHFLGQDASHGYYADLVNRLGLEQFVSFLPSVSYEEVPVRIQEYDAAIAYVPYEPTDWSYHPTLKVLEYKAVGIPIIATDLPPNRAYVEPGNNGFLCDNTGEDFAHAMLQLIKDRRLLEKTADNAQRGRSGLNWLEVSRLYETLYLKLWKRDI